MTRFDEILAAIPLTPTQPKDLMALPNAHPLEERIRHILPPTTSCLKML